MVSEQGSIRIADRNCLGLGANITMCAIMENGNQIPNLDGTRRRRLILLCLGAAILIVIVISLGSNGNSKALSAHLVGSTNDANGHSHLLFEITNRQSGPINYGLWRLETRTTNGWQKASNYEAQPDRSVSCVCGRSARTIQIIAPEEGTAIRGFFGYERIDNAFKQKLAGICRAMGLGDPFSIGPLTRFGRFQLPETESTAPASNKR
jgi:hypothetical protein